MSNGQPARAERLCGADRGASSNVEPAGDGDTDGKYATLGEAYVDSLENQPLGQGFTDDVVNRQQEIADQAKPSVPTMTEPIPEYSQPEKPDVNSDPYDIPRDYNPNDYVYPSDQMLVYTNPYDIPWTEEQQSGMNDSEVPIGQTFTDDVVNQVGVGAGRDGIYDGDGQRRRETNQPAVSSGGVNEAGADDSAGISFGGGYRGVPDSGGAGGGGGAGGSWGEASTYISQKDYDAQIKQINDEQKLIEHAMVEIETFGIDNPAYNYMAYKPEMGSYNDMLSKSIENDKRIEELKNQRSESAKIDPLFNTTAIINSQSTLGSMPYGHKGRRLVMLVDQ